MLNLNGQLSNVIQLGGTYSPTMLLTGTIPDGLTRNAEFVANALTALAAGSERFRFAALVASGASSLASSSGRRRYTQEASNAAGTIVGAPGARRFVASALDGEGTVAAEGQRLNDLAFFLDPMLAGMDLSLPDTQLLALQFNSTGMDRAPLAMD